MVQPRKSRTSFTRSWLKAKSASSRRENTPSLSKTCDTWCFTVSSLSDSFRAMPLFDSPAATADTMSISRRVSRYRFALAASPCGPGALASSRAGTASSRQIHRSS